MQRTQPTKNVLVLLPSQQDRSELAQLESNHYCFHYMDDPAWKSHEPAMNGFDPLAYIDRCLLLAREVKADGIFYTHELANFVAAVLAQELGLPGPPIESMFLTNHKLYGRAAERDPIKFKGFAYDSEEWRATQEFPVQVKPVSLFFSLLQSTARNKLELERAVEALRGTIRPWERPFADIFTRYVDKGKYPLAAGSPFLVEEFVDNVVSQHAVEGWSDADGIPHLWAVSDNNYFPGQGAPLDNNSVPSALSSELIGSVVSTAFDTVQRFGIRNGFWNAEIWIREDGRMQVTEVNGRMCATMTALYRKAYDKSQYPAVLKLACGEPIDPEKDVPTKASCVAAMFGIATKKRGPVHELIDIYRFEQLTKRDEVIQARLMFDSQTNVTWHQTGGKSCVARAWIAGHSQVEINALANEIRQSVLMPDD